MEVVKVKILNNLYSRIRYYYTYVDKIYCTYIDEMFLL